MKYIEADKLKAEIERLRKLVVEDNYYLDNYEQTLGYGLALDDMGQFFDTLSEEPDKSLEEAAKEYGRNTFINECMENGVCDGHDLSDAFIAGAEWQANHAPLPEDTVIFNKGVAEGKRLMLEDAVEVSYKGGTAMVNGVEKPFDGGNVRIIVLPKEE